MNKFMLISQMVDIGGEGCVLLITVDALAAGAPKFRLQLSCHPLVIVET
jgi:hypothetical protein